MALTIQFTPTGYASAHEDLIFTVLDLDKANDPITYPDFKYILDLYIYTDVITFAARLKAVPHPTNKVGIFNISNVVRNYVSVALDPLPLQLRAQENGKGSYFAETTVSFGEEYGFVIYPDLLIDIARGYFNNYNGRLIGATSNLDNKRNSIISVRPTATPVYRNAKNCFIPYFSVDTSDVTLTIKSYNGNGLINTITQVYTPADPLQQFNVSPDTINNHTPGFISNYIDYYTVEATQPTLQDMPGVYRFNLVCEAKYEVFTIHFLNRFGGFESRDFTKVSRKTIDIEKSEFGKLSYTMDSSGQISYYNSNKVYNETRSIYASQYKEKMTLNTDILTDAEYQWLGDLLLSPSVYIEMDGYFIPIAITGNNYEYKKTINDDLTNLTINIEFGDRFNAQFR